MDSEHYMCEPLDLSLKRHRDINQSPVEQLNWNKQPAEEHRLICFPESLSIAAGDASACDRVPAEDDVPEIMVISDSPESPPEHERGSLQYSQPGFFVKYVSEREECLCEEVVARSELHPDARLMHVVNPLPQPHSRHNGLDNASTYKCNAHYPCPRVRPAENSIEIYKPNLNPKKMSFNYSTESPSAYDSESFSPCLGYNAPSPPSPYGHNFCPEDGPSSGNSSYSALIHFSSHLDHTSARRGDMKSNDDDDPQDFTYPEYYHHDVTRYLLNRERTVTAFKNTFLCPTYTYHRRRLILKLKLICEEMRLCPTTINLAVLLTDAYMGNSMPDQEMVRATIVTAALLAAKFEERDDNIPGLVSSATRFGRGSEYCTAACIRDIELQMLKFFNFVLGYVTASTLGEFFAFRGLLISDHVILEVDPCRGKKRRRTDVCHDGSTPLIYLTSFPKRAKTGGEETSPSCYHKAAESRRPSCVDEPLATYTGESSREASEDVDVCGGTAADSAQRPGFIYELVPIVFDSCARRVKTMLWHSMQQYMYKQMDFLELVMVSQSKVAAACLLNARRDCDLAPVWPQELADYTTYTEDELEQIAVILRSTPS